MKNVQEIGVLIQLNESQLSYLILVSVLYIARQL